jgi:hypothetical protein
MFETPPSAGPNQPPSPRPLLLPESFPEGDLPPAQAHPTLIGHYRLQRPLGLGGIAEIHLAVDEQGRPVAIKQLRPELALDPIEQARFEREGIALRRIQHPNVLRLEASGHDDKSQRAHLACEFIRGLHLHDFVQRLDGFAPEMAGWIGLLLGRALAAAHAARIIHRDLKPTNVMIDTSSGPSQGRVVLIDYGSALLTDLVPLTPSGVLVGTPGFAAPEQLDRRLGMPAGTIDERADVYSLGLLLYTLLAKGRRPFSGQDLPELLRAMASERYEPLSRIEPRVPSYLEKLVARCLRFHPVDRPPLDEFRGLLSQGLAEDGFDDAEVEMRRLVADPAKVLAEFGSRVVQLMVNKSLILTAIGWRDEAEETHRRALAWTPTDLKQYARLKKIRDLGEPQAEFMQEQLEEMHRALRSEKARRAATIAAPQAAEAVKEGEGEDEAEDEDEAKKEAEPTAAARAAQEAAPPAAEPAQCRPEAQGPPPWWQRKKRQAVLLVAAAMAVLIGVRAGSEVRHPGGYKLFRPPLTLRELDGRTSHPAGAEYIPYPLGEEPRPEHKAPTPDLNVLGQLKGEDDFYGVATAWLLAGDLGQAEVYLDLAAPRSEGRHAGAASLHPDVDSDRAMLEMERGHLDEALRLSDGVLRAGPEHRPAKWNRALVLGRLDLGLAGATMFDGIKALGEPGWSVEAGQRAAYLRGPIEERRQRWLEVLKAGREMAAGGPIRIDLVDTAAGYGRAFLYDAVRAAPDAARVSELRPFAEALDEAYGGDVLQRYVQRIAARPFARRARLAKVHAQLLANYDLLDAQAQDRYLDELRRAGEDDLLLGTLVVLDRVRDHLAEYRRLAHKSGDPWFVLIADTEEAKAETARGEHRQAEKRLLAALDTCQRQKMEYRCVWIESALVNVYRSMDLLAEAEGHAQAGRALAKKTGDWQNETLFLRRFFDLAQARNDVSLSKAFLDEIEWRDPEDCERRRYVHEARADAYMRELRFAEARQEILEVPLCHQPRTIRTAFVLAYLDREGLPAEPWQQVRAEIADLRLRGGLSPGAMALAVHFEGVLLLGHLRHEGEALLRRAQIMSKYLRAQDLFAQAAYTYSYKELVLTAGRAGEFDQARALLDEAHGGPISQRCTLSTTLDGERRLVIGVDAEGRVHGHYDHHRTALQTDGLGAGLEALLGSSAACTQIHVFSDSSFHGKSGFFPSDRAWAFHKERPVQPLGRKSQVRRLVVRSPLLRHNEDAAPLPPWNGQRKEGETVTYLEGRDATPERVRAEMPRHTEVVFHVPCVFRAGEQQLLLSPDRNGKDTLSPSAVLRMRLPNVRLVTLTSCASRQTMDYFDDPWNLPSAFIYVGVGAVVVAYDVVLDGEAAAVFDDVAARIRAGQSPAVAVRDVRVFWLKKKKKDWARNLVVYD